MLISSSTNQFRPTHHLLSNIHHNTVTLLGSQQLKNLDLCLDNGEDLMMAQAGRNM
jgi:hypothetical protein